MMDELEAKKMNALKIMIGVLIGVVILATVLIISFASKYSVLQTECTDKVNEALGKCPSAIIPFNFSVTEPKTDNHGCLLSENYAWCEEKNKCIKRGAEACPSVDNTTAIMVSFE
jgi:hypothetical protein